MSGNGAAYQEDEREIIEVQYRNKTYYLREMSGTERDRWEMASFQEGKVNPLYLRARLVAFCEVDKDGKQVRGTSEKEVEAFSDKVPSGKLSRLFVAAQELNGIGADAVEKAEKNSASVPADASTSGLH